MGAIRSLLFVSALVAPLPALAQAAPAGKAELKESPALLAIVQPRVAQLREAGITQIIGRSGARNNIQVLTRYGPAYARWPRDTAPLPFELYFNTDGSNAAFANDVDPAKWTPTINAALDGALKQAEQVRRNATRIKP